jgi:Tat protein secretion system quality control protein TatD with DNase activity
MRSDDRIHLETGSNSTVGIEVITERVANLRGISTQALCDILVRNFNSVFNKQ